MRQAGYIIAAFGLGMLALAHKKGEGNYSMTDVKGILDDLPQAISDGVAQLSEVVPELGSVVSDVYHGASSLVFGTEYDELIASAAAQYDVPPRLLYRVLWTESRFRPDVINGTKRSRTGAVGIGQFMPATAIDELGSVEAALNPSIAIPGTARYLAKLKRSLGDWESAVAAYNWGIGNVKRQGLARAPLETVNYIASVFDGSYEW